MGQHNLSRMMKPQSVAVVGASEKGGTIGNALIKNLLDGGFAGTVMPVNPKYKKIHGCPVYSSVSELDPGVDLIGDAWQGKGIGANLLQKCLLIAEKRGFKCIHGVVLRENTHMLALGKKLGFIMKRGGIFWRV